MWRNHRSTFQDHVKYICNDIVKPFRVSILQYNERIWYIHDLSKYLPPPLKKSGSAIRKIGTSTTKSSMNMKFVLQLKTDSMHPFRINWMVKASTIVPYPTKNGVAFYPPWRLNITEKELRLRSRGF